MNRKLLIVEDDHTMRSTLGKVFRKKEMQVFESEDGGSGLEELEKHNIDVVLIDMKLPDMSGLEFWTKAKEVDGDLLSVFMTAYPGVKTAVAAMREGAFDYINKPFELDEIRMVLDKAFEHLRLTSEIALLQYERSHFSQSLGMIGQSDSIKLVHDQIYQVAKASSTPVLILGESGTGKELVADAVHNLSERSKSPILKVNCSAIPETLLESELFGHEKGSFTDAKALKKGIFEMADSGSIFLDEIGDMNVHLQPKLLRVLESKKVRRVGGAKDISIDVRLISATNQKIQSKVRDGEFRADLLYRLNVFIIQLPPLRERVADIPLLAYHFLKVYCKSLNKEIEGIEKKALEKMKQYSWPGNIRELRNVVERACIITTSKTIGVQDCSLDQTVFSDEPMKDQPVFSVYNNWVSLEKVELEYIRSVLDRCGGNKSEAARQLGISRVTLREKLRKIEMTD